MGYCIYAVIKTETPKAILISYENKEYWLPKSQVSYNKGDPLKAVFDGGEPLIDIEMPEWLAERKGFITADDKEYEDDDYWLDNSEFH